MVYRELFPRGLTALDDLDEATLGMRPNLAHVTAREEVANVLRQLKLPLDERGRRLEVLDGVADVPRWCPDRLPPAPH